MTDSFEKWINGMDDSMYEDWLEEEATEAQEEKALNIRTPISEQEEEDIESEQEYRPERDSGKIPIRTKEPDLVYDNRDLPPRVVNAKMIYQAGKPPVIVPQTTTSQVERKIPSTGQAPITKQPAIQSRQAPTIRQRIGGFFNRILRRNKK